MDYEHMYKKETGYDVGKYRIANLTYYDEDYVKWLEEQINDRWTVQE